MSTITRKLIIQGNKDDRTPRSSNFRINILSPIRSNTFAKSRKQSLRCFSGDSINYDADIREVEAAVREETNGPGQATQLSSNA